MMKDKRLLVILGVMTMLLLINGFLLANVYQYQQQHLTLLEQLQDQSSHQELQHQLLTESFLQTLGQLEEQVSLQDQTIQDTIFQLDWLTEENELLKKKLN
jgi:predicted PurR-regulated permease PerM